MSASQVRVVWVLLMMLVALLLWLSACDSGSKHIAPATAPAVNVVSPATTTVEKVELAQAMNEQVKTEVLFLEPAMVEQKRPVIVGVVDSLGSTLAEARTSAKTTLDAAKASEEAWHKALAQANEQVAQSEAAREEDKARAAKSIAAAEKRLATLEGRWFVRWGRWIDGVITTIKWTVGTLAVLFVLGSAFKNATGWLSIFGTIYQVLLTVVTFGLYPIGRLARWLRDKLTRATAPLPSEPATQS